MTGIGLAFVEAAGSALALIRDPAVVDRWTEASALRGFTVGGLAAHLGSQVLSADRALHEPVPPVETVGLLDHYARSLWVGAPLDEGANAQILTGGEDAAGQGPQAVAVKVNEALARLTAALPAESGTRIVHLPWWSWSLSLDDLLVTRMMEIAVHSDDLAVSVGLPTPPLPAAVLEPVLDLLARLATRRHGATALLRAYSRAERAPASIAAF